MGIQGPKYKMIYDWIADGIRSGRMKAGDRIPSENELGRQFRLSRQTVRHAIDLLEQKKLVFRIQGSGTYVGCEAEVCERGAI